MKHYLQLLLFFIAGCSSPLPRETLLTIDIEKAFNNAYDIFLSDFADAAEYISLETLPESLTGGYLRVFATDRHIIAISFRHNHLFDRRTGKFIREIGHYGRGPNEFMATNIVVPFDESRQTIRCANFQMGEYEFDLDGKVIRTLTYPSNDRIHQNVMRGMIPINEDCFVTYIINYDGDEPDKLLLFDGEGNVSNRFSNYHSFVSDPNRSSYYGFTFYKWENDVFFYEDCVDTLFQITKDQIAPYYCFHLGKYNPPYSEKQNMSWPLEDPLRTKYFRFQTINESSRFLFFSFWYGKINPETNRSSHYFGFYDKKMGITKVSKVDYTEGTPVINDLDHFAPLHPFLWNINQSGEMVTYIEASEIVEWVKKNHERAKSLPEQLKQLAALPLDTNPVVVIAKLKE